VNNKKFLFFPLILRNGQNITALKVYFLSKERYNITTKRSIMCFTDYNAKREEQGASLTIDER